MDRVSQLVRLFRERHPSDSFFDQFEASLAISPLKRNYYNAYERAFAELDALSWKSLSDKALRHAHETRARQGKGPFFDQLNDAFAYKWLVSRGFTAVSIMPEPTSPKKGQKCPDLEFRHFGKQLYCDVKTIAPSDVELRSRHDVKFRDSSRYLSLHPTFFKKLDHAVKNGQQQIQAKGENGLVFIIVNFDDFAMTYHKNHRVQIAEHLRNNVSFPAIIQFGIDSGCLIEHAFNLSAPEGP